MYHVISSLSMLSQHVLLKPWIRSAMQAMPWKAAEDEDSRSMEWRTFAPATCAKLPYLHIGSKRSNTEKHMIPPVLRNASEEKKAKAGRGWRNRHRSSPPRNTTIILGLCAAPRGIQIPQNTRLLS